MKTILKLVTLLCVFFTSTQGIAAGIQINDAWVREAPPGATVMAAYLTINNTSDSNDTLTGVSSNCCKFVEIHQSLVKNGQMEMLERKDLSLPAKTNVSFTPGDLHLMLIEPVARLREGDCIELAFRFAHHAPVTIRATVKKSTGAAHEHHGNH